MNPYSSRDLGSEYQQGIFDMLRGAKDLWLQSGIGLLNPNNPAYQYLKSPMPSGSLLDDPELVAVSENLPMLDPSSVAGMTKVFHGSPHLFKNWDFSKMGSGEGAQAYGHGGYFAGNRGVGEYYVDALSKTSPSYLGTPLNERLNKLYKERDQFTSTNPDYSIPENLEKAQKFADETGRLQFFKELTEKFRLQSSSGEPSFDRYVKKQIEASKNYLLAEKSHRNEIKKYEGSSSKVLGPIDDDIALIEDKIRYLEELKPGQINLDKSGHLYEIELKPDPEDFPMYDVPLKDQPMAMDKINAAKNRLEALKKERDWTLSQIQEKKKQPGYVSELPDQYKWADEMFIPEEDFPKLKPIEDEIQKLESALFIVDHPNRSIRDRESPRDKAGFKTPEWKPSAVIAEAFRTVGFPGHRFLDGMSRSGKRPEKNYNYVVYPTDEADMIKITNPPSSLLD